MRRLGTTAYICQAQCATCLLGYVPAPVCLHGRETRTQRPTAQRLQRAPLKRGFPDDATELCVMYIANRLSAVRKWVTGGGGRQPHDRIQPTALVTGQALFYYWTQPGGEKVRQPNANKSWRTRCKRLVLPIAIVAHEHPSKDGIKRKHQQGAVVHSVQLPSFQLCASPSWREGKKRKEKK